MLFARLIQVADTGDPVGFAIVMNSPEPVLAEDAAARLSEKGDLARTNSLHFRCRRRECA
jgi:hypothetical protein